MLVLIGTLDTGEGGSRGREGLGVRVEFSREVVLKVSMTSENE